MDEREILSVLNEFGLELSRVNAHVYEVLNKEAEVNTDLLVNKLRNCYLVTSERLRYERTDYVSYKIAHVYYVIIGRQYLDESSVITKECRRLYGSATIEAYRDLSVLGIDTVYNISELGR